MGFFRTVVGIDPSGKRLALSAVRYGFGSPVIAAPPAVFELRGERETSRMEEAGSVIADFVARNGLAGSEARLSIPADKVYLAQISFPPLKEKDLRPAIALELDRLFPFPASRLKFNWRRSGAAAGGKDARQIVVAVPSDYLVRWEELVSRAGLTLSGAIPSGWALSAAFDAVGGEAAGKETGLQAVLRSVDGAVECVVMEKGEPFFSSLRICAPGSGPSEAVSLLEAAMMDVPQSLSSGGAVVAAPDGLMTDGLRKTGGASFRPLGDFESRAASAMSGTDTLPKGQPVWEALGAYGAAICGNGPDLLSPEKEGGAFHAAARTAVKALFAVTILLAIAWPSAVALRTKQELKRLDREIVSLQPAVSRVEGSLALLGDIEARIHLLSDGRSGNDEPLRIIRDLTDTLPQGTWLTGLRVEDRKVEIDGLSQSANEIFPLLTRDGRFRKVEFASPITRQADNIERFQIRSEYVSSPPANQVIGKEGRSQ